MYNASLRNGYHPYEWKKAITLALRKLGKADYIIPKAYRLIALLNTLGKLLKFILARRLLTLVEAYRLLLNT